MSSRFPSEALHIISTDVSRARYARKSECAFAEVSEIISFEKSERTGPDDGAIDIMIVRGSRIGIPDETRYGTEVGCEELFSRRRGAAKQYRFRPHRQRLASRGWGDATKHRQRCLCRRYCCKNHPTHAHSMWAMEVSLSIAIEIVIEIVGRLGTSLFSSRRLVERLAQVC